LSEGCTADERERQTGNKRTNFLELLL
jgi:hypothetical protein